MNSVKKVIVINSEKKSTARQSYEYGLGITSQFYFCGLPLRLDTYSRCSFQCSYCFAHSRGGAHREDAAKIFSALQLRRHFDRIRSGQSKGPIDELLQSGQPIHFGGMSDPFSSIEKKYRASLDALKVLADEKHPTIISTKSDMLLEDEYLNVLKRGNFIVQVSLSSMDDATILSIDRGTPGPTRLMKMLSLLSKEGIPTTCRIQPILPGLEAHALDTVEAAAVSGVRHVSAEHLKLGIEKNWDGTSHMSHILGIDLRQYFIGMHAQRVGREWILPQAARMETIVTLRNAAKKLGMTYGAADSDFLLLSDGGCCCSGADLIPGFEKYFKYTYLHAARVGLESGTVKIGNLKDTWAPTSSVARYINSHSRLPSSEGRGVGLREYVARNWNGASNGPSPKTLYGLAFDGEKDENSKNVYRITNEFNEILRS